jgi:2-oxoglutarate dehydrogenase E2 component (dihydrolipoamide succinyltransferase)
MSVDVRVPTLGESVNEGVIVRWIKADGAAVQVDEPLLELETDKANVEIPATGSGVLTILKAQGEKVQVGEVVARIAEGAAARPAAPQPAAAPPTSAVLSPAVRRLVEEHHLDPRSIKASGRGGRLTKEDVLAHLESVSAQPRADSAPPEAEPSRPQTLTPPNPHAPKPSTTEDLAPPAAGADEEERVPMTYLRQRIAQRLVEAQRTAAILTTFNEVDMSAVMELRARYKIRFTETHGVSLGLMSFFARACIGALHDLPIVNAQIDGADIVYHKHVQLGIAVGTERGLVVPIVHDADLLSFAEIEKEIERLAGLARQHKLSIHDLSGGTFTISNGGVYGSLLSTPILNPPQSAILGLHKIEKRPVVVNDQVVVRPMMYLALSYDHRLVDGEQAVTFLVRIKERIEDPTRMMFGV